MAEQINLLGYKPILLKQMLLMLKEQLHDEGNLRNGGGFYTMLIFGPTSDNITVTVGTSSACLLMTKAIA